MALKKKEKPKNIEFESATAAEMDFSGPAPSRRQDAAEHAPPQPRREDPPAQPRKEPVQDAIPPQQMYAPEDSAPQQASSQQDTPKGHRSPQKRVISKRISAETIADIYAATHGEPPAQRDVPSGADILREKTGERYHIEEGRVLIFGSSPQMADITITGNNTISRRHAELSIRNGLLAVRDLGSLNGTRINGAKVEKNEVRSAEKGDIITLSDEDFRIC